MTLIRTPAPVTSRWRAVLRVLLVAAAVSFANAAPGSAQCIGDCNDSDSVSSNELIIGINIALGIGDFSTCPQFDSNGDETVTVDELTIGIDNALNGCDGSSRPTATPTPIAPTATPTVMAVCGNHSIEPGETCDDGNTEDGDNCPAACVIRDCQFTPETFDVDIVIQPPPDVILGSLQVYVRYPDGVVSLPSSGSQASVAILNLPDDTFSSAVNDVDYAVYVLAQGPGGLTLGETPANRFFTAEFNRCQGAAAPSAADFMCSVVDAALVEGGNVTEQTACSVVLP